MMSIDKLSRHTGAEHGGTLAAVHMVTPGTHVGAGSTALIDHAPQFQPSEFALNGHDHEALMAARVDPTEIIQNPPIHVL